MNNHNPILEIMVSILYGDKILNFVPFLIMDVYKLKVYNYFNNY